MIEVIALILVLLHFTIPLTYYWYAKTVWLNRPWNVKRNNDSKPFVSIIIPTYNEASVILERLENIRKQDYPVDRYEIIVVDSASEDETAKLVKTWASMHSEIKLKLIGEPYRFGKAYALNNGLHYASGEVVVIADADSMWFENSLSKTVEWIMDPSIGAVSCLKKPVGYKQVDVEKGYRQYYNVLRVAESKAYSTPIFHGELAAFKKTLLEKVGGFPVNIGADDSHTAYKISLMGFRVITPDDLWCEEKIPSKGYFSWRIRRAQHLVQHFSKVLRDLFSKPPGKSILLLELYLHLFNPWILLAATVLLLISAFSSRSMFAIISLLIGAALLTIKEYRIWIVQQVILVIASTRNLWNKEIVWRKQSKQ